jgi:hypothetical protein
VIVSLDVEFVVRGETAVELANAALSRLEQLNGGPLPDSVAPHLAVTAYELPDGTFVRWSAKVSATLRRDVEYNGDGGGEDGEDAPGDTGEGFWERA